MKRKSYFKTGFRWSLLTVVTLSLAIPVLVSASGRTASDEDITFIVNGQTVSAKDEKGKELKPVLIEGTVYVPAEAVSTALDMDFLWDSATGTISLTSKTATSKKTVTSKTAQLAPDETGYIGLEKAKTIALEHAGVAASKAAFFKTELDFDDGSIEYEIEFYSGDVEYDYTIEPKTGKILDWDHEVEGYQALTQNDGTTPQTILSLEEAKALAKAKAPKAVLSSCKLDKENGKQVYEGELQEGKKEYEFAIDAVTGDFLKWEIDNYAD